MLSRLTCLSVCCAAALGCSGASLASTLPYMSMTQSWAAADTERLVVHQKAIAEPTFPLSLTRQRLASRWPSYYPSPWRYVVVSVSFARLGDEQCYDKYEGGVPCDSAALSPIAPLAAYTPPSGGLVGPKQVLPPARPSSYPIEPWSPSPFPVICCSGGGGDKPPVDPPTPPSPVPVPAGGALLVAALLTLKRKRYG